MIEKLMTKKSMYYFTTLTIAITVGLIGGIVDILQTEAVKTASQSLGYPLYFFFLLGVFKVLGAIALLLPRKFEKLRDIAYTGFAFDFIFASYSHFSVNDDIGKIIAPLLFLVLLSLSYILKDKI